MSKKKPIKPDMLKRFARHVELTANLNEAETQAKKFAESCVALGEGQRREKGGCGKGELPALVDG